ncbi:capsular exopolysaccharide family [Sinomicrobium oceani]|uniref:Capsular exopolysaccharide family n=1 Tax=Sinomicrobium oceani TaxID=1150368 RepID=A0A1K1QZ42_9FLAO|nr:tyrosine-protein kinase [Sinomicrobium oceani]SFW65218.1 capsular exopolysaccharide family [Sinomicrobium oceani]
MHSEQQIPPLRPAGDEEINLRDQLDAYLVHWKWFVISVVLCVALAFVYLRYATPQYSVSATIMIKDDKKGGMMNSELSAFQDIGLFGNMTNSIDNEMEVLRSRTLMENVVKKLGLNVVYYTKGSIRTSEAYKSTPVSVNFSLPDSVLHKADTSFTVKINSKTGFRIYNQGGDDIGDYGFGEKVNFQDGKITVLPRFENLEELNSREVLVQVKPLAKVTLAYQEKVQVAPVDKNTSVIKLSLNSAVRQKAEDVLNTLIEQYNIDVVADKNLISENTARFIEKRLALIESELGEVEQSAESFKESNQLTDIAAEAGIVLDNASDYAKRIVEAETRLQLTNFLIEYLADIEDNSVLIPANVSMEDNSVGPMIMDYNKLVQERNRLMRGSTENNPVIVNLDGQISAQRQTIKQTLNNVKSSQRIALNELKQQEKLLSSKISNVPGQERKFRGIQRQQQIKETLYLYLLQKKEETAISLEVTAPNSKIIDSAYGSDIPVSPKKAIVLLGSFVLGLLIPFGVIYLKDLLDTKVQGRKDIEGKLSVPFLGDIPKSHSNEEVISMGSRTSAAEAFRILRTNLDFMLANADRDKAKKIFVTSTLSGEGKTFVSINLAGTLALSGKKVLLIGMDIRNPKLAEYLDLPHGRGITNYLTNGGADPKDLIFKFSDQEHKNLDVLASGAVPPNPAELLMNDKVGSLFAELEDLYDYIVVDTAPVSLVTDTLLISKYADVFVYVCRAGYLDKRLLVIPENLYKERRLPNMSILVNDTDSKKGYGYGYGYGYGQETKQPWWKRFTKR